MSDWNPEQYDRFKTERQQPFFDLLALVRPDQGMRIVDLGCGTGELTRLLHERLGAVSTLGIDTSQAMLAKAARHACPGLEFALGAIEEFGYSRSQEPSSTFDLVFSNAALHWVNDHPALLRHLAGVLGPSGQLAVQMPANFDHPSHTVAEELAREEPFVAALSGYSRDPPVLAPERYAELLHELGFGHMSVRLQVYPHRLPKRDDVVEWVKGTLLTAYEQRMDAALFTRFLDRYRERLLPRLSAMEPFFYPFKRVLFWAAR